MQQSKFNTSELMSEITNVLEFGLNKILINFMDRYTMLEETHRLLMQLPSIQNAVHNAPYLDLTKEDDSVLAKRIEVLENKTNKLFCMMETLIETIREKAGDTSEKTKADDTPSENVHIFFEEQPVHVKEEPLEDEQTVEEVVEEEEEQTEEVVEEEEEQTEEVVEEEEQVEEVVEEVVEDQEEEEQEQTVEEVVEDQEEEVVEDQEEEVVEEEEEEQKETVEEQEEVVEEIVEEDASIETETKEEEEEEELFEIEIDGTTYCTNDEENGTIWQLTEEGEQGEVVGYLKDGEVFFTNE